MELPTEIYKEIQLLAERGDMLSDEDDFTGALAAYDKAVTLLPAPAQQWEAWTWLQAARADVYYFTDQWSECQQAITLAKQGPEALGNPFLHLRAGQAAFELGQDELAVSELLSAYMLEGEAIFEDEEEYLDFLKEHADLSQPRKH